MGHNKCRPRQLSSLNRRRFYYHHQHWPPNDNDSNRSTKLLLSSCSCSSSIIIIIVVLLLSAATIAIFPINCTLLTQSTGSKTTTTNLPYHSSQTTSNPSRPNTRQAKTTLRTPTTKTSQQRGARRVQLQDFNDSEHLSQLDPMEPCYLANNRASETLTISESTPVGTVVGELMVNGDSSRNGNIELSIKMPSGARSSSTGFDGSGGPSLLSLDSSFSRRSIISPKVQQQQLHQQSGATKQTPVGAVAQEATAATTATTTTNLSDLIDLMPPLSIEQDTKRLILAKKLDRENLDRYIQAGGYQSVGSSGLSLSSSASLTVHIKCQLRDPSSSSSSSSPFDGSMSSLLSNATTTPTTTTTTSKRQSKSISSISSSQQNSGNSILIPIHLIITDENDNWPNFIGSPYIVELNESSSIGTLLQGNEIVAVDNDQQGALSTIEYSVVPGSLWSDSLTFLNPLDSRSLVVKDNRLLDFESQSKLALKVMARDQGEPANWAITTLYINLLDQDDLNPSFQDDIYSLLVQHNQPGEEFGLLPINDRFVSGNSTTAAASKKPILVAHDKDKTIQDEVVYSFHTKTNQSVYFDLDPQLAKLSLKKPLPIFGGTNFRCPFCLLLRATQVNNAQRYTMTALKVFMANSLMSDSSSSTTTTTTVVHGNSPTRQLEQLKLALKKSQQQQQQQQRDQIEPENSINPFRFNQSVYSLQLNESQPVKSIVFEAKISIDFQQLQQNGIEITSQQQVKYQLIDNDQGYFQIDETSGRITLIRELDYEMYRQLFVRILATLEYSDKQSDSGYPHLLCDISRLNIDVLDINEFAPEFSHEQYNFQLSVSDLIASFESPAHYSTIAESSEMNPSNYGSKSNLASMVPNFKQQSFGSEEGAAEGNSIMDMRALQLGQVYCADRDFEDKCSLLLQGNSKSSLFRLTQDGRLFLPLINDTANIEQLSSSSSTRDQTKTMKNISNQFSGILNRGAFNSMQRRMDMETSSIELDRSYLNYLLGELSNLARLRFKVLASDRYKRQSNSLIVITIISIDNFILHKAPAQSLPDTSNPIKLGNETSYLTSTNGLDHPEEALSKSNSSGSSKQIMMIPSTNGRSFVQINPDIISNLLQSATNTNNIATLSGSTNTINSNGKSHIQQDQMDSSASHPQATSILASATTSRRENITIQPKSRMDISVSDVSSSSSSSLLKHRGQIQPPGLLLVDDDGAKFVAMPEAIEVYQQQVQEAQATLQAQQQQQQSNLQESKLKRSSGLNRLFNGAQSSQIGKGFWASVKDFFSFGSSSSVQWINLSTAIMLHLVALIAIITLISKIRSSRQLMQTADQHHRQHHQHHLRQSSSSNSSDSNLSQTGSSSLWRDRVPKFTLWGSSRALNGGQTNLGFKAANGSSYGHQPTTGGSITSAKLTFNGSDENFVAMEDPSTGFHYQFSSAYNTTSHTNHYTNNNQAHGKNNNSIAHQDIEKQPNLFDHLKSTLNKMLDHRQNSNINHAVRHENASIMRPNNINSISNNSIRIDEEQTICIGEMSIRPLDSDVVAFEDLRDRQLELRAQQESFNESSPKSSSSSTYDRENCISEVITSNNHGQRSIMLNGVVDTSSGYAHSPVNNSNSITQRREKKNESPMNQTSTFKSTTTGGSMRVSNNNNNNKLNASKTIVSINVKPSNQNNLVSTETTMTSTNENVQQQTGEKQTSSNSSSVVSLVSMGSSLSNRISAAIAINQNSSTAQSDDVSSLDSSVILSGCGGEVGSLSRRKLTQAPAPPMPPPPPSKLQMSAQVQPRQDHPVHHKQDSPLASARQLPQNPAHVKLRSQAAPYADHHHQQSANSQFGLVAVTTDESHSAASNSGRLHDLSLKRSINHATSNSIGGRREARKFTGAGLALSPAPSSEPPRAPPPPPPPPPPPLPSSSNNNNRYRQSATTTAAAANQNGPHGSMATPASQCCSSSSSTTSPKTISPSTSVDRGYESLQSYIVTTNQNRSTRAAEGAQRGLNNNKLVATSNDLNNSNALPKNVQHRLPNTTSETNKSGQRSQKTNTVVASSTGGRRGFTRSRVQSQTLIAAAAAAAAAERTPAKHITEEDAVVNDDDVDEDFFYCCPNHSSHSSSVQCNFIRPNGGEGRFGGLLTEYASHTYKQDQDSSMSDCKLIRTKQSNGRQSSTLKHNQQQLYNNQSSSSSSNNNNNKQISHQQNDLSQQQHQQHQIDSKQLALFHATHSIANSTTGGKRVLGRAQRLTRANEVVADQQKASQRMIHDNDNYYDNNDYHHHRLDVQHHQLPMTTNKKQLTWSDQVEMLNNQGRH